MAYKKDNSGIENSCPLIDKILALTDKHEERFTIREYLEKVRSITADLRKWGNELDAENDYLKHIMKEI